MRFNIYILFFLLVAISCTPDPLPEPMPGEPIFKVSGTIDSEAIDYAVGLGDYYMDSYHEQDNTNVFMFNGAFKKTGCTNCTEELTIKIRDRKPMDPGNNFNRDLSFQTGDLTIAELTSTPVFDRQVLAFFNANLEPPTNLEYQWIFNEVDTTSNPSPVYRFPETIGQTAELTIKDLSENCTDTWEQTVQFFDFDCAFGSLSYENSMNGMVALLLPYLSSDVISSSWDFGDNSTQQFGSETTILHNYATPGSYEVCVDVELPLNCLHSFCTKVQSHQGIECSAGFNYTPVLMLSQYSFSTVTLEWTSKEGKQYSSLALDIPQPTDSFFEITDVVPFSNDIEGEKTMKITARSKVTLFNLEDPSDSVILETEDLVFAVAYPDQ